MTRQPTQLAPNHWRLAGDFADGAPFLNAVPIKVIVPMVGAQRQRLHFKTAGGGGTLAFQFVRPDGNDTPYETGQPVNLAVVAGTEVVQEINPHYGEGLLKITFTPTGNGNIAWADVGQV